MQKLVLLILSIVFFSCAGKKDNTDQVIVDRIQYVYSLRSIIDENIWKDFDHARFDLPLVYYTDTCCYVANPTNKFLRIFKPSLIFENEKIKIYKTDSLIDNNTFHMFTGFSASDTAKYDYKSPFMRCSSFEITREVIGDINDSEQWAAMVIHEYFHGFQFRHPLYNEYLAQYIYFIPKDSLTEVYNDNAWFKESVDKENDILLAALQLNDRTETSKLLETFFDAREKRRQRAKSELNFDLAAVEEIYETMEGTARYVEFGLYNVFKTKSADAKLVKTDTSYYAYEHFRKFNLESEKWLYGTGDYYYYGIGFNMARLLDKHKVEFRQRLFNENSLSLEQIVKESLR